jgi:hypothetical protein
MSQHPVMRLHRVLRRVQIFFSTLTTTAAAAGFLIAVVSARADSIEAGFQNPPDSAKPQTWWHWMNGNVTKEGITADLEAMKRVGIAGAQIFNVDCGIPAGPAKVNSPEWRELILHAAQEANRLGLEICLHNCAGWSSSGGPWNTPEHAMQCVTTSVQKVKGPTHFSGTLPLPPAKQDFYRDIAILAFRTPGGAKATKKLSSPRFADHELNDGGQAMTGLNPPLVIANIEAKGGFNGGFVLSSPAKTKADPGRVVQRSSIVDLTSQLQPDGRLDWNVPAGDWTILRLGYTPTGRNNHPAPAEATGLECDKFSKDALDAHWAGFVQKVLDDLGPLAGKGKTLDKVLIDSYEVGGQNWTPRYREEFRKRRGYDPLLYLPTLTGRVVDSPEVSERFLWDMRRTIADLFADNYYGHLQELCHEHGLKATFEPYTGPFDSLQCGGKADIPMGEFWVGGAPDASVKLASSIGHTFGQPIIGAESFTGAPSRRHGRWLDDPYSLKTLGDMVFCQGVNRYIFHRYAMQPWTNRWPGMTMGQWGTHFDRTSTWWEQGRAWLQYVARCQYLLQRGRFVADAAYFCGESAPVELRVGDPALPPGYDYDAINAGVLLQNATVKEGRLMLDSGMSYRLLILPPSDRSMRPELLRQLSRFVADGLTLVGPPPQNSPSLDDYPKCDAEVKELAAQMWGNCNGRTVTEHKFGLGKVVWGQPLAHVLATLDLKSDFEYPSANGARLAFIHRHDGDDDIYFVSNQQNQFAAADCSFRITGKAPELWNPETGHIEPAPVWREQEGRTVVPLSFDPAGSMFVVFRAKPQGDHLVAVHRAESSPALAPAPSMPAELRILKALYGALPAGGQSWLDVTASVKSLVANGTRQIPASNDMAGDDPAPNIVKRLRVEFILNGRQHSADATEGGNLDLPAGSEVVKALYGDLSGDIGRGWLDVTARVKSLVARDKNLIQANNSIAGFDPAPNIVKQLRVEFRLDGKLRKVEIKEGKTLEVPVGAEIVEALYGNLHERKRDIKRTVDLTEKLAGLVRKGELSVCANNSLAGGDPASMVPKELRVEYSLNGVRKSTTVEENAMLILPETSRLADSPPSFAFATGVDGQERLLAWAPDSFLLTWASGRKSEAQCPSVPAPVDLGGPWQVSFPPGWNAPARITFDHLQSWTANSDPGVKYFSGTAAYEKEIDIPGELLGQDREIWLDLGAVKNFAEVSLNGQPLVVLWKPPFRVNVTAVAKPGKNQVEIKVTNLWPNRLIGDEQLPPDCEWKGKQLKNWPQWLLDGKPSPTGRVTFTTWHHWTKEDELLDSGLLGPVTLQVAEEITAR